MAAADIGVMVLYFSMLNALKHWASKMVAVELPTAVSTTSTIQADSAVANNNDKVIWLAHGVHCIHTWVFIFDNF
jgi:hypothetical protein